MSATNKNWFDRRKHERFKVKRGAFAVLVPSYSVLPIKDIGLGGLSFYYRPEYSFLHTEDDNLMDKSQELSIFLDTDDFVVDNIAAKIISDAELAKDAGDKQPAMRRCSMAFEEMTPFQTSQIEYFILNHTTKKIAE